MRPEFRNPGRVAALLILLAVPAWADDTLLAIPNDAQSLTLPYSATDWLPAIRGNAAYLVPAGATIGGMMTGPAASTAPQFAQRDPATGRGLADPAGGDISQAGSITVGTRLVSGTIANYAGTDYNGGVDNAKIVAILGSAAAPDTSESAAIVAERWDGNAPAVGLKGAIVGIARHRSKADKSFATGGFFEGIDDVGCAGANCFVEGARVHGLLGSGATGSSAYGLLALAGEVPASRTTSTLLIGVESTIDLLSRTATPSFGSGAFAVGYNVVVLSGSNAIDAGYIISPNNPAPVANGFLVPAATGIASLVLSGGAAFRSDAPVLALDSSRAGSGHGGISLAGGVKVGDVALRTAAATSLDLRHGVNQRLLVRGPVGLAGGSSIFSADDALAAAAPLEIRGSIVNIGGNSELDLAGPLKMLDLTVTPGGKEPVCIDTAAKQVYYGRAGVC